MLRFVSVLIFAMSCSNYRGTSNQNDVVPDGGVRERTVLRGEVKFSHPYLSDIGGLNPEKNCFQDVQEVKSNGTYGKRQIIFSPEACKSTALGLIQIEQPLYVFDTKVEESRSVLQLNEKSIGSLDEKWEDSKLVGFAIRFLCHGDFKDSCDAKINNQGQLYRINLK